MFQIKARNSTESFETQEEVKSKLNQNSIKLSNLLTEKDI